MTGPSVLGIDLSSRSIDLVRLDENESYAERTRIELDGKTALDRTRDLCDQMPRPAWYDARGIYLVAVEQPFGVSRRAQAVLMMVMGAVIATIPQNLPVWSVNVSTWKQSLGLGAAKPTAAYFPRFDLDGWPQDALDALGVALYARDENARGIAAALNPPTGRNQAA